MGQYMKYLYIPTTTLNFNSILSTESISPAAVCALRGFGNKRFEKVDPNPFENVLLLYDKYPIFNIEDSERDNYPMVLRISAVRLRGELLQPSHETEDVCVYTRTQTIFFDPSTTVFFFPTSDALRITTTKAEPSLTTKLVSLYEQQSLQVKVQKSGSFDWSRINIQGITDDAEPSVDKCCKNDIRTNRLKGFVYGYVLGAYRSVNPRMANLASETRELANKASAIMRDQAISFPENQRKRLDECWSFLKNAYMEAGVGGKRFNPQRGDSIKIKNDQIEELLDGNESHKKFTNSLVSLVNDYCLKSEFSGQLDEVRKQVALDGAQAIKTYIGEDNWENSGHRNYLTDLVNNVASGGPFDFNNTKSIALLSFAAFVLKGDDLEKLQDFLISNGISDFRIAFALWGAMFGFSKIPKTVFNLPSSYGDQAYSREIHRYVHSVVHRILLKDIGLRPQEEKPPSVSSSEVLTGEPRTHHLDQLYQYQPRYRKWDPELRELMNKCGGNKEEFCTLVNSTSINDLGGPIGCPKKGVLEFFQNLQSSRAPSTGLPDLSKPLMLWSDKRAWDTISNAVPHEDKNDVHARLIWFQNEWQNPNSKYYGSENKQAGSPIKDTPEDQRTNTEAIKAFYWHLRNNNYLDDQPLAEVERILKAKYL